MAKGNLFQGMGRGKVGDVVFSRLNGEQISRVRNRHPKNPRSNSQLYQRAVMATVMQAYAAGKEIFDHSFEGYAVGAQNQRRFLSLNSKLLRQLVAADINTPIATNSQKARVVGPGVSVPVADPFIISRGSYQQTHFEWDANANDFGAFVGPMKNNNETIASYVQRNNLKAGDIYTFVIFAEKTKIAYQSNLYDDALASVNYCDFGFIRMKVKENLSSQTGVLNTLGQIFDFESNGGIFETGAATLASSGVSENIDIAQIVGDNNTEYTKTGAIGLIRSRQDMDLRSDSVLNMCYGNTAENMYGIASDYILDEWKNATTSVGNSDLILEGGNI